MTWLSCAADAAMTTVGMIDPLEVIGIAKSAKQVFEATAAAKKVVQKSSKSVEKIAKKTKLSGGFCFVAGTQILTEDGYKSIEEVKESGNLWAKNVETGEESWKPVTKAVDEDHTDLTYNFMAADYHTYYVTKHNVLVHNCGKQKQTAHSKERKAKAN